MKRRGIADFDRFVKAMTALDAHLEQQKEILLNEMTHIVIGGAQGRDVSGRADAAIAARAERTDAAVLDLEAAAKRLFGESRKHQEDAGAFILRIARICERGVTEAMLSRGFVLVLP